MRGTLRLDRASPIASMLVVATKISVAVTDKRNRKIIETKEITPPDTPNGPI
ncbi:hypothetical protein SDC9_199948 [bioreactor metagenome]|uniref:Uncharacterized protein n=1 Tax=bioreactor metagenome TaxID=1076179 RepID=A0A645IN67_9ZZZZ